MKPSPVHETQAYQDYVEQCRQLGFMPGAENKRRGHLPILPQDDEERDILKLMRAAFRKGMLYRHPPSMTDTRANQLWEIAIAQEEGA